MKKCEPHSALFAEVFAALFLTFLLLPREAVGQRSLPSCSRTVPIKAWDGCQGSETNSSGGRYVGEYRNGQRNGRGTYSFADRGKYVGEFKDDQPNGQGVYTYAEGSKYVGEFKDGRPNGQGTATYANGNKYVGEFKDGKENGKGTKTASTAGKFIREYVGEFKDGKENGLGTHTEANGNKYVGEFKDDKPNGQGTATYANGNKYVGEFKDGQFHGQGTRSDANGSIISAGIWLDGRFVGTAPDQETVQMDRSGGVYVVPVRFNDTITLDAVVDSGASDVSVPADIVLTLMRTKTVTKDDFLGKQTYVLADGSEVPSQQFRIRSLKVGNKTVENVVASIVSVNATILLGQSFLSKFKSWSVDNEQHTLILR